MSGELQQFACPVCGRIRPLSRRAALEVTTGRSSGECPTGLGCRGPLAEAERFRRFWLQAAGIPPRAIRAAGGSREYVAANGLPDQLRALADLLPEQVPALVELDVELETAA